MSRVLEARRQADASPRLASTACPEPESVNLRLTEKQDLAPLTLDLAVPIDLEATYAVAAENCYLT